MRKTLKRAFALFLAAFMLISLCACASTGTNSENGGTNGTPAGDADTGVEIIEGHSYVKTDDGVGMYEPEAALTGDFVLREGIAADTITGEMPDVGAEPIEGDEPIAAQPGLITAGAQDDNDLYNDWLDLFKLRQNAEGSGKFFELSKQGWKLDSQKRVKVTVKDGGTPVANALVTLGGFNAVTNANGVAYLFTDKNGTLTVKSGEYTANAEYNGENELTVELSGSEQKGDVIDLMFVVDVTGSMGDEITYLQKELEDVIKKVAANNPAAAINLAFLFYRDEFDAQEFYYVNFKDVTDEGNLKAQLKELNKQYADGGGDYPEALDEALEMAVNKNWSENSTKLLFLVLDAPAHEENENKTRYSNAVTEAAKKGIRVCPVLASGADTLTEYLTRSAAILTGGTFVFITDHSGIGGAHHDPDLPDVVIERLNRLLIRLINGYHTGTFAKPVAWTDEQ